MTTLGLHANTNNQQALLLRYCQEVKPSAVKLLDPNRDVVNAIRAASPNTIIIGRQYWSDQRLDNYGEFRSAAVEAARRSGVDYMEGYNEWGLTKQNASSFAGAELSLARELNRHGIGAAIGGFSTGYLDSNLDGDRSWTHFHEAFDYMESAGKLANGRPKCVLHFHEYSHYLQYGVHIPGSVLGPDQWDHAGHHWTGFAPSREYYENGALEGWWTLRYRKLWKVLKAQGYHNICGLITEFGCDDVNPRPCGHGRGWRDFTGCEHFNDPRVGDFVDQCAWYMRQVSRDPYILGVVDFGFATADPSWLSFDFSQTPREFDKLIATQRALSAPAPPPGGTPVATLNDALRAEFGAIYEDLRTTLPTNPGGPNGPFLTRPLAGLRYIAVHHTASAKDTTWRSVADEHIRATNNGGRLGAAGIGYHVGIRRGRVSYLGDVSTSRANVGNQNHLVIGVCVTGDYTHDELDAPDRDALARVVKVIDTFMGRALTIAGHGALPGQATACPGPPLTAILGGLRAAAPGPAPAPGGSLAGALRDAAAASQKIRLNKGASIQGAALAAGLWVTGNEFEIVHDGTRYVAQRAEHPATGQVRVLYCRAGDWSNVQSIVV